MRTRPGAVGWALVLAGCPWSAFVLHLVRPFEHLDLWHAQSFWVQMGVLVMAGVHTTQRRAWAVLPSACWWLVLWLTGFMLWQFTSLSHGGAPYPAPMLLGVVNLWMVLLAIWLLASLPQESLRMVCHAVFWSGCLLIGYGWIQVFNLDPFFHAATVAGVKDISVSQDVIQGTLGNPTHFACQLALWLPLAVFQPGWRKLWLLPALGLLSMTLSATAVGVAGVILLTWVWRLSRRWCVLSGLSLALAGAGWSFTHAAWLNPHGRWETWRAWWEVLAQQAIVGGGLGFTKYVAGNLPAGHVLKDWKHLHNEYLQLWVEGGLIGLVLLGWLGWQLWQRRHYGQPSDLRWAYGMMLMAFALMACLNFPAHLWGLGMFGVLGMAGWLVLTQEEPHAA